MQARLAWTLATCADDSLRDGARALELARAAVATSKNRSVMAREALAAALAETGDFEQALHVIGELSADPDLPDDPRLYVRLEQAREAYNNGRPFR